MNIKFTMQHLDIGREILVEGASEDLLEVEQVIKQVKTSGTSPSSIPNITDPVFDGLVRTLWAIGWENPKTINSGTLLTIRHH